MTTKFLAVTGAQGSGKSVFINIVKNEFKIPTFRLGDIIIDEINKRKLKLTGRNMAKMASVLRFEGGDQVIAQRALPKIIKLAEFKPKLLLIDGIRSYSELAFFREQLGEVTLIAIITSLKTRKGRVDKRQRIDNQFAGDFEEREQRELGFGLGNVITKADYFILNEDVTKEKFIAQIKLVMEKIMQE